MTNYRQYLYYCLMEEAGEVIQEVAKVLRFGEENFQPSDINKVPNIMKLRDELIDMCVVIDMLGIADDPNVVNEKAKAKREKVNQYFFTSMGVNTVPIAPPQKPEEKPVEVADESNTDKS